MFPRTMLFGLAIILTACSQQNDGPDREAVPFLPTATIQDIMRAEIDPAADLLWESVGTTITAAGEEQQQPRTDEEWDRVRNSAITLIEATNLLVMKGRRVVAAGREVEDAHLPGISNAQDIQAAIAADWNGWITFAHALHAAGERTLQAIDARNPAELLKMGETLDEACEACHAKYWYPNQVVPDL